MAAGAAGVTRTARDSVLSRRTSKGWSQRSTHSNMLPPTTSVLSARLLSPKRTKSQVCHCAAGEEERGYRWRHYARRGSLTPEGGTPSFSLACSRSRRPQMQLAVLWTLLASSSALSPGARPRTCRREALCGAAAAALSLAATPTPAFAEYGQSAGQKLPAFVPSPIRPTGEMAKTCEIVALGREVAAARSKASRESPD